MEKSISHKGLCVWFKRILLAETLEGTETVPEENRTLGPQSFPGRKHAKEVVELQAWTVSWKKKLDSGQSQAPWRIILGQD